MKANTYGGTIGGPIKKNAVFFFGSFEGYKREQSLFTFFSVPSDAMRNGDFSGALNTNGTHADDLRPRARATPTARAAQRSRTT